MTTHTFYSATSDGYITSEDTSNYAAARAGTGDTGLSTDNSGTTMLVGQLQGGGGNFVCHEAFILFDTSSIDDAATIDSATLSLWVTFDLSTTDFINEARLGTWGPTLADADYIAGANLGSHTLLAQFDTSGGSASGQYHDFTSEAAMVSNINLTGDTEFDISSDRQRNNTSPSGNERLQFSTADHTGTTQDPKLVVVEAASNNSAAYYHHRHHNKAG